MCYYITTVIIPFFVADVTAFTALFYSMIHLGQNNKICMKTIDGIGLVSRLEYSRKTANLALTP